jgi:hypothetical protein
MPRLFCSLVALGIMLPIALAQERDPRLTSSPRYAIPMLENMSEAYIASQVASVATIPLWSAVATDPTTGLKYTFRMVGQSIFPTVTSAQVATVPAPVVALDLRFFNGHVYRPEVADPVCLPNRTAVNLTLGSPIYKSHSFTFGVFVGTTQYVDAFQRANFWSFTGAGAKPNYHVFLNPTSTFYFFSTPITVPSSVSGIITNPPCGTVGAVSISWVQSLIRNQLIPGLSSKFGIGSTQLPVFLLYNVVMCPGNPVKGGCGIVGFHDGYTNAAGHLQTYTVSDFDTSGIFPGFHDVESATHEVGEWMDDPTGRNPVPPYGKVGQVSNCQNNLEVGDPLSGHTRSVLMPNGFTYHVQELAFASWFYHIKPAGTSNRLYSDFGTFKGYAKPCPPGGTF